MIKKHLRTDKLSFEVDDKRLISDISIEVPRGSFVGIMGPNGSGKSTLLKNMYKAYDPTHGAILINEENINVYKEQEYARLMAVVNQENSYSFDFKVIDILEMACFSRQGMFGRTTSKDTELIIRTLESMELEHLRNRSFLSLSGGEKQRVLIARAIIQDSDILVLDEPTNHLDIKHKLEIMSQIKSLDKTIISAVHDFNVAMSYCDYIIMLKDGYVVYEGTPDEVLSVENIKEVFGVNAHRFINPMNNRLSILLY